MVENAAPLLMSMVTGLSMDSKERLRQRVHNEEAIAIISSSLIPQLTNREQSCRESLPRPPREMSFDITNWGELLRLLTT